MKVGELFVNLGIKGHKKLAQGLEEAKKGLGEVFHSSLETKAALAGMAYELGSMIAESGKAGTNLTNFGAVTGLSAQTLQRWQYAARQAGVSGQEFTGSLKAVQTSMTNMLMGKGAPEGMALLANKVGFDPKRARDTFYVLEQLQKFAKTVPNDIGNSVMKSFGLSEGTIAAMRRNAFTPGVMKHAPVYGDKEIGSLDKANIAWSNLGEHIEMAVGHFNAKHGEELVDGMMKVTEQVIKLVEAFMHLSEKMKLFDVLGKTLGGVASFVSTTADLFDTSGKGTKKLMSKYKAQKAAEANSQSPFEKWWSGGKSKNSLAPSTSGLANAGGGNNQTVHVQQNLNFQHDGKDHAKTGDSVKKAAQHFVRQSPVQGQAS